MNLYYLAIGRPQAFATSTAGDSRTQFEGTDASPLTPVDSVSDEFYFFDDVIAAKPSPEIYLLAASRSGFEIASSVAIEDSVSGIESSKMAGLFTIGLRTDLTSSFDLSLADMLIDKLDEIDFISILGMIESKQMVKR